MRLTAIPLALALALSSPASALDAGQRSGNTRDPDANDRDLVTKRIDVGDGPSGLILGSKPLSVLMPSVTPGGDMLLLPSRKIGRVQDGKYIARLPLPYRKRVEAPSVSKRPVGRFGLANEDRGRADRI